MLATDTETVPASIATSWSFRPGALGNSIAGSFFDEYMLGVVAQEGCCGVFGCTESDEEPKVSAAEALEPAYEEQPRAFLSAG